MIVLISKNFLIENLSVRFAIPVISVIFKNSAAVTNTQPGLLGRLSYKIKLFMSSIKI